ncbi:MAG: hypothetical protein HY847_08195 [Betaproteobacteria bacterium]|nr:hypothetical protein [Betaproteobacteria bacterium]
MLLAVLSVAAGQVAAGGLSSSVTPGSRVISGKILEWAVPTPKYARDPAIDSHGNVYFAVRKGDKIARFEPKAKHFHEWDVPAGMEPRAMLVARDGKVFFSGAGNNALGEFDPSTGKIKTYAIPSAGCDPYTLVFDAEENIWFTEKKAGKVGKFERASGKFTEYPIGDEPYGLSWDKTGSLWVTRKNADRIVRLNPKTGRVTEILLAKGSQPRRTAVSSNGMLWVSLYGIGRLAKIDPAASRVVKEYDLPGGPNAGPYAVNADGKGRIWVSEIQTDNVVVFDPLGETMQTFKLPSRDTGIRKAAIDAEGRYWYVGSNAGMLGVIE